MAVSYPTPIVFERDGTSKNVQNRLLYTNLGDGLQAVAEDGINAFTQTGTFSHVLKPTATAKNVSIDTFETFMNTNRGTVLTVPDLIRDKTGATTMNVVVDSIVPSPGPGESVQYTVTYRRVFHS